MSRIRGVLAFAVALLFAVSACEQQSTVGPDGEVEVRAQMGSVDGDVVACQPTGTGLTAVLVNEDVVGSTIDIGDCDVGAFFNVNGVVQEATFLQPDDDPGPSVQFLVRVEGAKVDVTDSEFNVTETYEDQIVHVGYLDGASGFITDNNLTGFKRAGILLDGEGSSGQVRGNMLDGVGPKSTNWAENGIQISRGASAVVRDNVVTNHWWDLTDFCSSGIIIFQSDNVTAFTNTVEGNDCGIFLWGDRNDALQNSVVVEHKDATVSGDPDGSAGFGGVLIVGDNNGVRQNVIEGDDKAVAGIWVFGGGTNNKLIRNSITGFDQEILDSGDETKLPPPFDPNG